jgi:hypothetical protein
LKPSSRSLAAMTRVRRPSSAYSTMCLSVVSFHIYHTTYNVQHTTVKKRRVFPHAYHTTYNSQEASCLSTCIPYNIQQSRSVMSFHIYTIQHATVKKRRVFPHIYHTHTTYNIQQSQETVITRETQGMNGTTQTDQTRLDQEPEPKTHETEKGKTRHPTPHTQYIQHTRDRQTD